VDQLTVVTALITLVIVNRVLIVAVANLAVILVIAALAKVAQHVTTLALTLAIAQVVAAVVINTDIQQVVVVQAVLVQAVFIVFAHSCTLEDLNIVVMLVLLQQVAKHATKIVTRIAVTVLTILAIAQLAIMIAIAKLVITIATAKHAPLAVRAVIGLDGLLGKK
jgi:hypothetical protein